MIDDSAEQLKQSMIAVSKGDRAAFARLYQLTSHRLMGIAVQILHRRDWAEEVLQEGFLSIWRRSTSFDPSRGEVLSWMAAVIRYRAIDFLRARRRENAVGENLRTVQEIQIPAMPTAEDDQQLFRCLRKLPENHRKAILMAFYNGLTHGELSEHLDAPLGTVKSWVRRGLAQLKECLLS